MSEWISIKDQLPSDEDRVLTCTSDGQLNVDNLIICKEISEKPMWGNTVPDYWDNVTHWMELPEAPKKEHRCYHGYLKMSCKDTNGKLYIQIDDGPHIGIKFCPFCGGQA